MGECGAEALLFGWEGTLEAVGEDAGEDGPRGLWGALIAEAMAELCGGLGGELAPEAVEGLRAGFERRVASVYAAAWLERQGSAMEGAGRVARVMASDWVEGMLLFAERLKADEARLAGWMGVAELPAVVSLRGTASEVHGREGPVLAVGFDGGGWVYYKPRPVTGEMLWGELVGRVDVGLRTARVLACAGYGWMEMMEMGVCAAGVHWRRSGALLCLAACVGMGDLHMANVVATAEGPVVVDAECLGAGGLGEGRLLGTGLLPVGGGRWPDTSGLFGGAAAVAGVLVPRWRGGVELVGARLVEQANRHAERGEGLAVLAEMVAGYEEAERGLWRMRGELLGEGGWADRVEALHAPRIMLRTTIAYGLALSRSVRSGGWESDVEWRRRLRRELEGVPSAGGKELVEAELDDLVRMRIPRVYGVRGMGNLVTGGGGREGVELPRGGWKDRLRERLSGVGRSGSGRVAEELAGILFRAVGERNG